MSIQAGQELGPYRIQDLLGQGAMGEVFRATDPRLGRDVAVKFLPEAFAADPERLRRFEQEARAIAQLNHPNIVQVFDTGTWEGMPFLVMELVEGQTLRAWMAPGPVPARKAAAMAMQIAQGLAAAHEAGIAHRDLKPENVLIGRDGRPRILDFGLAKLFQGPATGSALATATLEGGTEPGRIVGTVGYMAPEQLTGGALDGRTDLFALGVILWELLTGERPFQGDSFIDTMHAILRREPADLPGTLNVPQALERTLRRCLEKDPAHRFQNARDLAFALQHLDSGTPSGAFPAPPPGPARRGSWRVRAALAAALVGVAALGLLAGHRLFRPREYRMEALLPYPMIVTSARFMPDGKAFVFSAAQPDGEEDLFLQNPGDPEPRALQVKDAEVLAVSPTGEMALRWRRNGHNVLALLSAPGLAPRVLEESEPMSACWDAEGKDLIVCFIAFEGRKAQAIVYRGKPLYLVPWGNRLVGVGLCRDGSGFGFVDDQGSQTNFKIVDLDGRIRSQKILPIGWEDTNGLVYADDRFVILDRKNNCLVGLREPSLTTENLVTFPGTGGLLDGHRDGSFLVTETANDEANGWDARLWWQHPGDGEARPVGPENSGWLPVLARGGATLGFTQGFYTGQVSWMINEGTQASTRIGAGSLIALTERGDWGLVGDDRPGGFCLSLVPTGPGRSRELPGLWVRAKAWFFEDGRRALVRALPAAAEDRKDRCYLLDTASGQLEALPFPAQGPVSRDRMAFRPPEDPVNQAWSLVNLDTGREVPLPDALKHLDPVGWSASGRQVVAVLGSHYFPGSGAYHLPVQLNRVDLDSGRLRSSQTVKGSGTPRAMATVFKVSEDGRAFTFQEFLRHMQPTMLYRLSLVK